MLEICGVINGKRVKVYTLTNAAKKWGLATSTLRCTRREGRFKPGEITKPGHDWWVTEREMIRIYGKLKEEK